MARFTGSSDGGTGPAGPTGPQGPAGADGADGTNGVNGIDGADALWNFTGAYDVGTAYAIGDVATYEGQTWYRIDSNGGNVGDTPSEGTFWTLIAQKGDTGAQGEPGVGGTTAVLAHDVKAGEALTKGQAVYVSSADGTNMIVSKASNDAESTSSKTMGLISTDLAHNGQGTVIAEGLLAGLDTSTATAGDPVWLGTSGNLIYGLANKPVAPAHLVFIGIVTRANASNGEIFVKVQNGFELKEIHDVLLESSIADNEVLAYDTTSGLWKNQTAAEAGIVTLTGSEVLTNKTIASISAGGSAISPTLYDDTNTGHIQIGSGLTSGIVSIARSTGFAGTVNIAAGTPSSGTRTINIGTGATGGTTNLNIGSATASGSTTFNHAVNFGTISPKVVENGNGNTSNISLFPNQTAGNINIAQSTSFNGSVNIAAGATTVGKTVNIGTSGTAGNTLINIGTNSGGTGTTNLYGTVALPSTTSIGTVSSTEIAALDGINDAWTTFTPALSTESGTWTIGNGSIEAAYKLIGKTCHLRIKIVFGSTTSAGSGTLNIGLPFTAANTNYQFPVSILDQGLAWYQATGNGMYLNNTSKFAMIFKSSSGTSSEGVTATAPFTPGSGDYIALSGTYEIA